jgi:hypothetical protein
MNQMEPMGAATVAGLLDITQATAHFAPREELNYFARLNN